MAIGDQALAAGMDLVAPTDLAKDGPAEINKTRDYIAEFTADVEVDLADTTGDLPQSRVTGSWSKAVSTNSSGRFGAAYNNDISAYTRRVVWMRTDGTLGHAPSTRRKKQDIRPAELTLEQLRSIPVVLYRNIQAVVNELAGKGQAATEIGTIAEELHDAGLWQFVWYEGRGESAIPAGVHYDLLALAALSLGQQLADKLDQIELRLQALEGNTP
jgi:hypothetical protein